MEMPVKDHPIWVGVTTNYVKILSEIVPEDTLLADLKGQMILTDYEYETINASEIKLVKVSKMIDSLCRKPEPVFRTFLQCLTDNHQRHVVELIEETAEDPQAQIKHCYKTLLENIQPASLLHCLQENNILNKYELEMIQTADREEQKKRLMAKLGWNGEKIYEDFLQILRKSGHRLLAGHLCIYNESTVISALQFADADENFNAVASPVTTDSTSPSVSQQTVDTESGKMENDGERHLEKCVDQEHGHPESAAQPYTVIEKETKQTEIKHLTPLHMACFKGNENIVKILLDKNADVNAAEVDNWTPLHMACQEGHPEIVTMLLDKGANINPVDAKGWTPLHQACCNGHCETVNLLLIFRANKDAMDNVGWTPLHQATNKGHQEVVFTMLKEGANVNAVDHKLWTPLHHASSTGHEAIVKLLLIFGANINDKDQLEWTALHHACEGRHEAVAQFLITEGINVKAASSDKWTPLHQASKYGLDGVSKNLIAKGANVGAVCDKGWTPLHHAAAEGCKDSVTLLLDNGADINATTRDGVTPVNLAIVRNQFDVVCLLIERGAELNAV